jgi:ketosteroid isomerase-like protein
MNPRWIVPAIASLCLFPASLLAQGEKPPDKKAADDKLHDELREFRKSLIAAVNKGDVAAQLEHVTPDVVVTWQNGEVVKGRDNLRKFYEDNVQKSQIFKGYVKEPEPAELTVLYGGDAGISYGTSVGKYSILGMTFELKNHWSATLTKEDGKWRIANYHVSANVLDNPVLNAAKNSLYWVGGIAVVVGLLVGFLLGRLSKRSSPA